MAATLKQQRGPWKIDLTFDADELHVRPRDDLAWHPLERDCPCRPREDTAQLLGPDGRVDLPVFFHAALDGRAIPPPTID